MKAWLLVAFLGLFVDSVSSQLTPWDNQLFDFGWSPYDATISRCTKLGISWNDRPTANPSSTGPYQISILTSGYQPIIVATEASHGYNWTVSLPVGGPYILTMKDANDYTGGTSLAFNVQDPAAGVTCGATSQYNTNALQVTSTGSNAECSNLVVSVQGGTPPYTMQIFAAQRPPKTTTWTTSTMSYTIDLQPSEQFFVVVTDNTGLKAVEGIHTVVNGDTTCYERATTVIEGALPTTLSYDPSSTVSIPPARSSSSSSSSRVIQNTQTTTIVTVVTHSDGSSGTYTVPPGSSTTIPDTTTTPPPSNNVQLPAIIGGAVGGAALLVIALIAFLWHRRRSAQMDYERKQANGYKKPPFSPVGPQPMPFSANHIIPYTPPTPASRDTAPLMAHVNSMHSSNGGSVPNTPGLSQFAPNSNNNYLANPGHQDSPTPAWAIPTVARHGSIDATNYTGSSSTPSGPISSPESGSTWSGTGIPPGAMAPRMGSIHGSRLNEKARFTPSSPPSTVAPPPYSQGG